MKVLGKISRVIQILLQAAGRKVTLESETFQKIAGTADATASATITGTTTAFLTDLADNDIIYFVGETDFGPYTVVSRTNDTEIVIDTAVTVTGATIAKISPATNPTVVTVPNVNTVDEAVLRDVAQTITNKNIDADQNTLTNIEDADIKAGANIDAAKLGTGVVDNTDFNKLDTRGTDAADELATTDAAQNFTNKTLTSPTVNTPDINGGTIDGATIDQVLFTTTGAGPKPYTVTVPYDVTLTTDGPVAFEVVTTEAELTAALLLGGTIGINANITLTGQAVLSVADTELVCLNKKYSLTAAASNDAPIRISDVGCVVRNVQLNTTNDAQDGIKIDTGINRCQVADCTVKMPDTSTANAVYCNGSFNRITDLLAYSVSGAAAITGVTLDINATDNLVSGVIVD
jgi:hypothetical protein